MKINTINKENLVGYWSLAEADTLNGSVKDLSGNGNDGSIAVTPATFVQDQNGVPNQAMSFDGVVDYVTVADSDDLDFETGDFSISLWANFNTLKSAYLSLKYASGYGFIFQTLESGVIYPRFGNGSGLDDYGNVIEGITANNWHQISIIINRTTGEAIGYLNGVKINIVDISSFTETLNASGDLLISGTGANSIDGSISDVAIYSSALTQDEVSQLYLSGRTTAKIKMDAKNFVTNGGFDTDLSGWSAFGSDNSVVENGRAKITGNNEGRKQTISTEIGKTYKYSYKYQDGTIDGNFAVYGQTHLINELISNVSEKTYSGTFIADDSSVEIRIFTQSGGNESSYCYFDDVSVTDITDAITPSLQKGLILDMPLAEPYTEAGSYDLSTASTLAGTGGAVNISGNTVFFTANSTGGVSTTPRISFDNLEIGHKYKLIAKPTINSGDSRFSFYDGNQYFKLAQPIADYEITFEYVSTNTFFGLDGKNYTFDIDYEMYLYELDATTKDRTPNGNDGTVDGATLKYDGLVNTADGIAYIPSDTAYGTWEFDVNKGGDGNSIYVNIIAEENESTNFGGYQFGIESNEGIILDEYSTSGFIGRKIGTVASYVSINTDYRIKITRSLAGVFTVYIKGGEFGWDDWTTVGSATDNTYTTSNYFVTDCDAGDKISNLKIDGKPISLSKATQSSGTWEVTVPSYSFDGVDDYIDLGTQNYGENNTISLWLQRTESDVYLLGQETEDYVLYVDSGNTLWIKYDDNAINTNWTVPLNIYGNLTIVKNGTDVTGYWNGEPAFTTSSAAGKSLILSKFGTDNSTYPYKGMLALPVVYNYAISAPEAYLLYVRNSSSVPAMKQEIPEGYELVMSFDDNASDTSTLQAYDEDGNSVLVDWGDGILQEISISSETISRIIPSKVKIYSRNGLSYFKSTNNNFDFNLNILPTNLTSFYCAGSNTISGNLADLPTNLTYFYCTGSNTISGNLADLPTNLTYFRCSGSNTISGNLADLPTNLTHFLCYGSNTVSGDLADLPTNLTSFRCSGSNTVSGDLADLPTNLTSFYCYGSNTISAYTNGHIFNQYIYSFVLLPATGYGLDSTEVDNLLIDLDASGMSSGTINISGNNAARTSASDDAIASLTGNGVRVTTN